MNTPKKYRFRLAWQNYRVGDVIEPPGTLRDWLLSNGYVEPAEELAPPPPPATQPAAPARKRQQRIQP